MAGTTLQLWLIWFTQQICTSGAVLASAAAKCRTCGPREMRCSEDRRTVGPSWDLGWLGMTWDDLGWARELRKNFLQTWTRKNYAELWKTTCFTECVLTLKIVRNIVFIHFFLFDQIIFDTCEWGRQSNSRSAHATHRHFWEMASEKIMKIMSFAPREASTRPQSGRTRSFIVLLLKGKSGRGL